MSNPVTIQELINYHSSQALETRKVRKQGSEAWIKHLFHEDAVQYLEGLQPGRKKPYIMDEEDNLGYHMAKIEVLEADVERLREKNRLLSQETIATFDELRNQTVKLQQELNAKNFASDCMADTIRDLNNQLDAKKEQVDLLYCKLDESLPHAEKNLHAMARDFALVALGAAAIFATLFNFFRHGI